MSGYVCMHVCMCGILMFTYVWYVFSCDLIPPFKRFKWGLFNWYNASVKYISGEILNENVFHIVFSLIFLDNNC